MDNAHIQKLCQKFLEDLHVPGFIVFGWKKSDKQYGFTYVNHKTPPGITLKGMLWAAKDFAEKKL